MITLLEINKAVNNKVMKAVQGCFEYDIPIVAEDLSEPVIRPSIKVIPENLQSCKFNNRCKERNLTYNLYFFPKDKRKPKFENMKIQESIENEFIEEIKVPPNFIIPIKEMSFEVSDGILICSFELYTVELLPDKDTSEPMEELKINM